MKKLFVGNLAWKASEDDLRKIFEEFGGVISVKIVLDQYTGKSKGFGFVEMDSQESADAAISGLNDKPFQDRNLRVSIAQDRPPEGNGGGGGGRSSGGFRSRGNDRGERGASRGERPYSRG